MKPLDDEAKRIIARANQADVAPDAAQAQIWQRLSQRFDAPLPPTAATASRALEAKGFAGAFSGALAKLVLGAALVGALGAGAAWYLAPRAPVRQAQHSKLPAPAVEPPTIGRSRELVPAQREAGASAPSLPVQRPRSKSSALQAEATLIAEAQRALNAAAPARALALLARHRARFPRGELAPERDAAQVFALCAMGRETEALAARERFLRSFPESPLAARIRAACRD